MTSMMLLRQSATASSLIMLQLMHLRSCASEFFDHAPAYGPSSLGEEKHKIMKSWTIQQRFLNHVSLPSINTVDWIWTWGNLWSANYRGGPFDFSNADRFVYNKEDRFDFSNAGRFVYNKGDGSQKLRWWRLIRSLRRRRRHKLIGLG